MTAHVGGRPGAGRLQALGLGLLLCGAAAWALATTVADPARVAAAGEDLATSTVIRQHLAERMRDATAAVLGTDPAALEAALEPAADQAVDDPRVRAAFASVAGTLARSALEGPRVDVTLDVAATTAAMRDALRAVSPADAAALGPGAQVVVTVGRPPDLSGPAGLVRAGWPALLLAGVAVTALGAALDPHPARALGRAGRWLAAAGVVGLLGGVALPLALRSTGGWPAVLATVVGTGTPLLAPASGVLAAGVALAAGAHHRERSHRRRILAEPPRATGRGVGTLEW